MIGKIASEDGDSIAQSSARSIHSTTRLISSDSRSYSLNLLPMEELSPPASPAPFSDLPLSDDRRSEHSQPELELQDNANALSNEEKRNLVRRGKKLQAMLGANAKGLGIEQSFRTVRSAPRRSEPSRYDTGDTDVTGCFPSSPNRPVRRASFPPPSPTLSMASHSPSSPSFRFPLRASMKRQSSGSSFSPAMSMSRSSSSAFATSPETALDTPRTPFDAAWNMGPTLDSKAREERRRRIAKVYAVLGERVPVEHILHTDEHRSPQTAAAVPLVRSGSRLDKASGMLSKQLGKLRKKRPSESSSDESWEAIRSDYGGAAPYKASPIIGGAEVTIDTIRRARKLEDYFGQLPPAHLRRGRSVPRGFESDVHIVGEDGYSPDQEEDDADLLAARRASVVSTKSSRSSLRKSTLQAIDQADPETLKSLGSLYREDRSSGEYVANNRAASPPDFWFRKLARSSALYSY